MEFASINDMHAETQIWNKETWIDSMFPCTYKRIFNRKCNYKNTKFPHSSVRQKLQRKKGSPVHWLKQEARTHWLTAEGNEASTQRRVPWKLGPGGPSKLWVNDDRPVGISFLSESENWQLWSHNIGGCWYHLVIVIRKLRSRNIGGRSEWCVLVALSQPRYLLHASSTAAFVV